MNIKFINSKDSQNVNKISNFYLIQDLKDLISKIKLKDAYLKSIFLQRLIK